MPIPIEHVYEAPGIYTVRLELAATGSGTVFSNPIEVTVLPAPADMDGDQDVDMDDFAVLQACLSGTTVPQDRPECVRAKLDGDSDVDLEDVNLFIRCLSGPNRKSDPFCIP